MTSESTATKRISTALIDALLPGAGYFGATPDTCLKIEVGGVVDRIEISVEAPAPEILNIGEISFESDNGETIFREEVCARIEMSSTYGDAPMEKCFADFLAGRLIHSKSEPRPLVRILMKRPTLIRRLVIKNRADIYGARSRHLVVRTFLEHQVLTEQKNFDDEKAERDAAQMLAVLGLADSVPHSDKEMSSFVTMARRKVVEKIEENAFNLTLPQLYQLLPLMSTSRAPMGYYLTVCAHMVLLEWGDKSHVNTRFLQPLSLLLATDLAVERLSREIGRLLSLRTNETRKVVISRHHIHEARLINRKDAFLSGLDKTISALSGAGVTVMLGYGTLLGAVRNDSFLPHDDDVDLIYFDGSNSEQECNAGKQKIIDVLMACGIHARGSGYDHLHATVERGIVVDLFPVWREGNSAYLAMEQLKVRPVPFDHLFPTSTVSLHGRKFPAPANPEAFLANRYGEGWCESDPYYEWPWRLERILTRVSREVRSALDCRARQPRRHWGRLCRVAWGQRVMRDGVSPPKNCLRTITVARETGYDAVELDVLVSADGVPVLAHDDRLSGPDGEIVVTKSPVNLIERFRLGIFNGEDVYVPTLEAALLYAKGIDVQLDSRIRADEVRRLRECVERANFDPTRLQFCVYDIATARALLTHFPESVLMWKTYRAFADIDEYFMDEAKALGLDGLMVELPPKGTNYSEFMKGARARGLRVLFFVHSGDDSFLEDMIQYGVDYVTTLANSSPLFEQVAMGWQIGSARQAS